LHDQGKASRHLAQPPLPRLAKKRQKKKGRNVQKKTENTPTIDFNQIPRQNAHSHIILKLQSPNYYHDFMNMNVAMKTTISNNRNVSNSKP